MTFLDGGSPPKPPLRVLLVAAAAALAALTQPACEEETPTDKPPVTAADPAEQGKIDRGKALLKEANEALSDKKYDRARKLLAEAKQLSVESQRFDVEAAQEKLDKRQAKLWANEVDESFKNKDCAGAFKQLSQPLKDLADSEAFTGELRRLVSDDALKCVQEMVDQKIVGAAFAEARRIAANAEIVTVLGPAKSKKLAAEIEESILDGLHAQVDADVKGRKWVAAMAKIDAAGKKGDASAEQTEALLAAVREGVAPEIAAIAGKALGQRDAPAALRQVDQLATLVHWVITEPGLEAAVQIGAAMPEELAKKREALAVWVEAQRIKIHPLTKPEARWTHGRVQVFPAAHSDAASKRDIAHGTQVWIIGTTKDRALVTTTDPAGAKLVTLLGTVTGWAATDRLARETTADWLPPDDQLKGERVWGLLRPPEPLWELGVVIDVNGKDLTVQRLADGARSKLTRQKLRSGRLAAGTKVITFCIAKDQPAQVMEVPATGRSAKLKCDGGQEKEEDLASLRSKPELLPATK